MLLLSEKEARLNRTKSNHATTGVSRFNLGIIIVDRPGPLRHRDAATVRAGQVHQHRFSGFVRAVVDRRDRDSLARGAGREEQRA